MLPFGKKSFKYLLGIKMFWKNYVLLYNASKDFEEIILDKVTNIIKKGFDSDPVYNDIYLGKIQYNLS